MPAVIVPKTVDKNQLKLSDYSFFFFVDSAKGIFASGRWKGKGAWKGFNERHVMM